MVYTLGEMLLDVLTEKEIPREQFATNGHPGGAMLNAAVSLTRSGIVSALISEIGDDAISSFLLDFLKENKVQTKFINRYDNSPASVALARLNSEKKADYTFLKSYPRHRKLRIPESLSTYDVLLFGSLYALDPAIRPEIKKILQAARNTGTLIMYDPNIRMAEQLSDINRKKTLFENLKAADIIKGSDEDFDAVFGQQEPEKHISALQNINPDAVLFITLGARGALAAWKSKIIRKPAPQIKVISTIGAGDGFNAGVIAGIIHHKLTKATLPQHLEPLLDSGIAFSTAVCQSQDNYIPRNGF